MNLISLLIPVVLSFLFASGAMAGANEPLAEKIEVFKTKDGHIILVSTGVEAECIAQAKTYIDMLLPHAQALAGEKIEVSQPDGVFAGRIGASEDAIAEWQSVEPGHGSIVLYNDFCRLSALERRVVIAHELGHSVDAIRRPAISNDSAWPWGERQGEIAATAWAHKIYQSAHLPGSEIALHYSGQVAYLANVQSYSARLLLKSTAESKQ